MATPGGETQEPEGAGLDAREYLRVIARRFWTIVVTVLVCAALAGGYALSAAKSYEARTTVLLEPVVTDWAVTNTSPSQDIDTATEQTVARSDAVAEDVRSAMKMTDVSSSALLNGLTVSPGPGDAATLIFTYSARDPAEATNLSLAFANAYLARREAAGQDALSRVETSVRDQINQLEEQLSELGAQRLNPDAPETPAESIVADQIGNLRNTLARLSLATVSAGTIISRPAEVLTGSPQTRILLLGGVLLGLVLGLLLAFLRDRMSSRIALSPAASGLLRPSILETIPMNLASIRRHARGGTLPVADPGSPAATAFSRASEHVRAQLPSGGGVVVVTSATDQKASSVVATNLAVALSETGMPVTLLTSEGPATSSVDGAIVLPTFSDVLGGRTPVRELKVAPGDGTALRVVPFGEIAPGMLRTEVARELVRELRVPGRVLVIDAPPILARGDGLALVAVGELILLTVVDGVTRRSDLVMAAEHAAAIGPASLQTILIRKGRASARTSRPRSAGRPSNPAPALAPSSASASGSHERRPDREAVQAE